MTGDPDIRDDVPLEDLPMEEEVPRRAASAQFEVEADVGSEAALREAMDPANKSLADALRLSYRVLQIVIVVLILLFLVSGFQNVDERQSGVMLRFGDIVGLDDEPALEPGLHRNVLPYPAGEFVIFEVENRSVSLGDTYFPRIPEGLTLQQAIDRANVKTALKPGEVGYVQTREGDLAHLRVDADYEITDPVQFVERLDPTQADEVVTLALQRAVVHSAAGLTLQELVDQPETAEERIRAGAQATLDALRCGINIARVRLPDNKPPFAIVKTYGDLQNAREEARKRRATARQKAEETLIDAAGPSYQELVTLVKAYEDAEDLGDVAAAAGLLDRINAFLESDKSRGEVSRIIRRAQAYESEIELTVGRDARQFASHLPSYREQPELTWKRLWLEAYTAVLGREDAEIFRVNEGFGSIKVAISGSEDVQKLRRREGLRRKERAAQLEAAGIYQPFYQRAQDWEIGEENPLLEVIEGRITGGNEER